MDGVKKDGPQDFAVIWRLRDELARAHDHVRRNAQVMVSPQDYALFIALALRMAKLQSGGSVGMVRLDGYGRGCGAVVHGAEAKILQAQGTQLVEVYALAEEERRTLYPPRRARQLSPTFAAVPTPLQKEG